jgi:hypothetical protein
MRDDDQDHDLGFEGDDDNLVDPGAGRPSRGEGHSTAARAGHPAGSADRHDDDGPRIIGRVSGLSAEVDADGDFILILHLESPAGRSHHGLNLTTENVKGLHRELGDCLSVLADLEALGAAADEVLSPFDDQWVVGPGDPMP